METWWKSIEVGTVFDITAHFKEPTPSSSSQPAGSTAATLSKSDPNDGWRSNGPEVVDNTRAGLLGGVVSRAASSPGILSSFTAPGINMRSKSPLGFDNPTFDPRSFSSSTVNSPGTGRVSGGNEPSSKTTTSSVASTAEANVKNHKSNTTASPFFSGNTVAAENAAPNFIAEFNYIAKEVDEISLEKGDLMLVEHKGDDNWFQGLNITKQVRGAFPGNFVVPFTGYNGGSNISRPSSVRMRENVF